MLASGTAGFWLKMNFKYKNNSCNIITAGLGEIYRNLSIYAGKYDYDYKLSHLSGCLKQHHELQVIPNYFA